MDSKIKEALTGATTCKLDNEKDLLSKDPTNFTASISGVKKVYSLFPGKVLFLGFYNNMGTLVLSASNHEIIRYLNLKNIEAWSSQEIRQGDYLGESYANKPLLFEYCTHWKGDSVYPVRTNNNLYYKQNPIDILSGTYVPTPAITIQPGINTFNDRVEFTDDQRREWLLR